MTYELHFKYNKVWHKFFSDFKTITYLVFSVGAVCDGDSGRGPGERGVDGAVCGEGRHACQGADHLVVLAGAALGIGGNTDICRSFFGFLENMM